MVQGHERRRFPRIKDRDISIELTAEGFSTITQSLDVSASGIYCKVDRHIPVMTRMQVILKLPKEAKSSKFITMKIDGVVVREHLVKKEQDKKYYDVAIFFNTLTSSERNILIQYINNKMK